MNKSVWITGAGSGIGEALARVYHSKGYHVILSGRTEAKLRSVSQDLENSTIQVLDVSDSESIKKATEIVLKNHKIDVLVHNAGISQRSLASETKPETGKRIMEVNFFGAVNLTQLVLNSMTQNSNIVVISSAAGKFGFPLRSFYAASKHALHGYFESLALELKDQGIKVTIACPGRINTEISKSALQGDGAAHNRMDKGQSLGMDPMLCAKKIVKAMERGKMEVYIGGKEIILIYIKRYWPWLYRKIAERVSST